MTRDASNPLDIGDLETREEYQERMKGLIDSELETIWNLTRQLDRARLLLEAAVVERSPAWGRRVSAFLKELDDGKS